MARIDEAILAAAKRLEEIEERKVGFGCRLPNPLLGRDLSPWPHLLPERKENQTNRHAKRRELLERTAKVGEGALRILREQSIEGRERKIGPLSLDLPEFLRDGMDSLFHRMEESGVLTENFGEPCRAPLRGDAKPVLAVRGDVVQADSK